MVDINELLVLEDVGVIIYLIKTLFINIYTYYIGTKLINQKLDKKIMVGILIIISTLLCGIIKYKVNACISIIYVDICLAVIFCKYTKNSFGQSILIISISLSINYILLIITLIISFVINVVMNIQNDYISLSIIIIIYTLGVYLFQNVKRFKKGFIFLKQNLKDEYFDILLINISIIIMFSFIILTGMSKDIKINRSLFVGFIIFSIMMFITIQKSLQLYYKQKLLMQDLKETKEELEDEKKLVKELEKEILGRNKSSHTISHKQKILKHKIDELMEKSKIASEIDIIDKVNELSKEISSEKVVIELDKTEIEEIDDVLSYMQSECAKNKIEFELQLNGNIHKMINNYVSAEDLQILIADHVKNAIIAIQYSNNIYKSIMVRLGEIDGCYSLYIYDSGIEFEEKTLDKLGKEPSTTHEDNGGTGMGFMNTFDTLNKYKASMTIKEIGKLSKDNYTKLIMIKFDNKNEFRIDSYRR